ncbi:hypothetical protein STENM223S_04080 [Streptomyces tendae]
MSALSSATSTRAGAAGDTCGAPAPVGAAGKVPEPLPEGSSGSQRSASSRYGSAAADTLVPAAPETIDSAGRCAVPKGRRTRKRVPRPSVLWAVIVPPCSETSSHTSARPIPLPSLERDRTFSMRWNRSNSRGSSASGTPIPVSATVTTAWPSSSPTPTRTEPSKVNFSALLRRFRTTFSHMPRSMYTGSGRGAQSTWKDRPARSNADRKRLASSVVAAARSTGS